MKNGSSCDEKVDKFENTVSSLPVPVAAQAQMSLPIRPIGTQAFWMGVGCLNPMAVMAW